MRALVCLVLAPVVVVLLGAACTRRPGEDSPGPQGPGSPLVGAPCPAEEHTARLHFRVPRAGDRHDDFYRLPFPSDVRRGGGRIRLAGHPGAAGLLPRYLEAIEADAGGFSTNGATFFRLSRSPAVPSFVGATSLVDLQTGSLVPHTTGLAYTGRFLCGPALLMQPPAGQPLRGRRTYAALIERGPTDESGAPFVADADLRAMLAPTLSDDALAEAWAAHAPLRAHLSRSGLDPASLIGVALFTTDDVEGPVARLREAVLSGPPPTVQTMVRCGEPDVLSPCDDGRQGRQHQRGCLPGPTDPPFDEHQALATVPVFQSGTPPYEQPGDGGGIVTDASGHPRIQRMEPVCLSITVPRGAPPAGGWPVLVYAHGTGGDYRSAIVEGIAGALASAELDGRMVPAATVGFDAVLHGPRRGRSERRPDELVYNLFNPRAARDTSLQAAADLFAMARLLEALAQQGLPLDTARVALWGQSQGGSAAALAAPFEPRYGATILSGTGGLLMHALLGKRLPIDIPALLPLALGDAAVDANHPALSLMQLFFERSDPVNFARRLALEPVAGTPARHILHVYGSGDSYAPETTQQAFARAAGLPVASPVVVDYGQASIAAPVTGNMGGQTVVQIQYRAEGFDGHFVYARHPAARRAINQALAGYFAGGAPVVTP